MVPGHTWETVPAQPRRAESEHGGRQGGSLTTRRRPQAAQGRCRHAGPHRPGWTSPYAMGLPGHMGGHPEVPHSVRRISRPATNQVTAENRARLSPGRQCPSQPLRASSSALVP